MSSWKRRGVRQCVALIALVLSLSIMVIPLTVPGMLRQKSNVQTTNTGTKPQPVTNITHVDPPNSISCQIIYVVGVEGAQHHGVTDMLAKFAQRQADHNGHKYVVKLRDQTFRRAAFWSFREKYMDELCPSGERHVIIEDGSFPSGFTPARKAFKNKTTEQIAAMVAAKPQVNLTAFSRRFARYGDVRFVVLHRPFANTVVSHAGWDGGLLPHARVMAGHLLYLGGLFGGGEAFVGAAPWTLLCVDKLRNIENTNKNGTHRQTILAEIAQFLKWDQADCANCFNFWRDSRKDPEAIAGPNWENLKKVREKVRGVWPPILPGASPEQQNCAL